MTIVIDSSKEGLEKILKDYQIESLRVVWDNSDKGVTSREVYMNVNKVLENVKTISRASIINFLNDMCDEGVLTYEEETCKGGMRRKYFPKLDEEGLKKYVAKVVFQSLFKDFPEQTVEALGEIFSTNQNISAKLQKYITK
ncbi:MAG: BlaI/MecI/CopY family transcriptional regulator [Candidatus Bathyarchaeia archaeon]